MDVSECVVRPVPARLDRAPSPRSSTSWDSSDEANTTVHYRCTQEHGASISVSREDAGKSPGTLAGRFADDAD
jgi:hypothetical protein